MACAYPHPSPRPGTATETTTPAATAGRASRSAQVPAAAANAVSSPGTLDAWEAEGGAVPGVLAPRPAGWLQRLLGTAEEEATRIEAELRAETGYDEENRVKHYRDQRCAADHVPALGLAWSHVRVLQAAEAWRLVRAADGRYAVRRSRDATKGGRKVSSDRVETLIRARYLTPVSESTGLVRIRLTIRGAQALYLVGLHPEGVHADEKSAYQARWARAASRWMSKEDRKAAARRLPHLPSIACRWYRDRPVTATEQVRRAARTVDTVSDPGTTEAWESDGGAVPKAQVPTPPAPAAPGGR
jgi:hypothetical protein